MARIFTLLSVIAVTLILLVGASVYWFSLPDIRQAKQNTTRAMAKGISLAISSQLDMLQQSLDGLAHNPEVIDALQRGNDAELEKLAAQLEPLMPKAQKLRLLPPHVRETDQSSVPHMGFADLEMVKATLAEKQPAMIQGQGPNRHLAITSLVSQDGKALGVLLASLRFDFVNDAVRHAAIDEGLIKIKQQRNVLISAGNVKNMAEPAYKIPIPHSAWQILYWPDQQIGSNELTLILSTIALCGLSACLAFFIGYRKLAGYLREDQGSITKVAKDLLAGKIAGNYPVQLQEMKAIITTLIQFKRVIDNEEEINSSSEVDFDDGFFDEGLDTEFLDQGTEPDNEQKTPAVEAITPKPKANNPASKPSSPLPIKTSADTDAIFRAYDIRGIVDQTLTPDIVFKIGQAFASEAKALNIKTIVLGRDGRPSSRTFAKSLAEGIVTSGCDVLDIGLIPTPMLYFVAHHSAGRSGVMVTGSHNPPNYNGIKMMLNGETLAEKKIQGLKQRIDRGDIASGERGSIEQNTMFTNEYIGLISEDIHIVRPMKIVLDCGNGAAGELAPVLLRTIGCEVVELYCDVDGNFPNHHPDPSKPENLDDLIASVKHHQADVGIALDGDGDRLGIVDCNGKIIWPDRQLMLFAKDVLSAKPGAEIIFDVKCSRHLGEQIIKNGGRPLMWKTGHALLKAKLKETGAPLAGEMSGHIIFYDRWFGFDDGLYAAARMIEILSADSRPSNEVFADLPDSVNTPELTVTMAEGENQRFVEQLLEHADFHDGSILHIDGMRVDFDDGWGLVRASNTTPSLVLRFEADTQEALTRIQTQFKNLMLRIKPDLTLPF
ncbi:phosphomannomutase/phosphoglucomutase [Methylomarinum sp. Ch1-1]|uniref:phosphomannomutase n=1 Tax=Methylomarinum roseum TaxID=3067653 RepID=A0AAU7NXH0_9GAMM